MKRSEQASITGLWLVAVAVAAAGVLGVFGAFGPAGMVATSQGAESKAPDFALPNLDGKDVKLAELLAKGPVVIDFWATWCKPCIKGFPALQQIHDRYKERGVTVLAISVDSPKSQSRVAPFIKGQKFTFTVLLDGDGQVAKKYSATAIPRTVLVNKTGEIVYTSVGYRPTNEEKLEEAIKGLLPAAEPATGATGMGGLGNSGDLVSGEGPVGK